VVLLGRIQLLTLWKNGFEVISIDDNSRSSNCLLDGIEKITGKKAEKIIRLT